MGLAARINNRFRRCGALVLALAAFGLGAASGGTTPEAVRSSLRLADDRLTIELVAAEPDVISPVAIAWDEDGRLYVAEMIDYPVGPEKGRVRRLEDRDGDGRFERATVFAGELNFPNGVLPWNGGVLVTAAPDLWFLKDGDGDGRADERRAILTGFGEGNTQLRANGLLWGLDSWVYGANGRSDGVVRRPADPPGSALPLRHHDFRLRPQSGAVEAVAGFSQFGLARDDWGNRFLSWNTEPFRHVVIEERDLARNPYLAAADSVASLLDPDDRGRIFPIAPAQPRFNRESIESFNASCGTTVFRGDRLGEPYEGNIFVCEPLTNLVDRRVLVPYGPTFRARRAAGETDREFLASDNPAFRPVNLATGPDGALYVVDFGRDLVEHPDFVPKDLRAGLDFRKGHDRGRIWRIRLEGSPRRDPPRLGRASTDELIAHLGHPVGWWRDTAHRLLIDRADPAAVPPLRHAARHAEDPRARVLALACLEGLHSFDLGILANAMGDREARVREFAIQVVRRSQIGLEFELVRRADDPDARVRLQAALALGDCEGPSAVRSLARIVGRGYRDESAHWTGLAVLSGLKDSAGPFLSLLLKEQPGWSGTRDPEWLRFLRETAEVLGASPHRADAAALLDRIARPTKRLGKEVRLALAAGLGDGLERSGRSFRRLGAEPAPRLDGLAEEAAGLAVAEAEPAATRALAFEVLSRVAPDRAGALVPDLLAPSQPQAVQIAAARRVADLGGRALMERVLGGWDRYATSTRRALLAAMLRTPETIAVLLDAVSRGTVPRAELDAATRQALLLAPDPALRRRAEALFARQGPDRAAVVAKYREALGLDADAGRGAAIFARNCLTCHQLQGRGHRVGAGLAGIAGRPKEMLLIDLLDPSRDVAPDFLTYLVATSRGQVLTGLLVEETPTSLKLRRAEGVEDTVLRSEVDELRATGASLMPEGLEQSLGPREVADLLEFLHQGGRAPLPRDPTDHPK